MNGYSCPKKEKRSYKLKKISVIIPCYNCEALIGETLECLLNQTYRDFEVICVNDGSTDGTRSVLEAWRDKDVLSMQIINKENGGVSSARNAGIEAAEGNYLLFLDSDDLYHPEYIERLVSAMEQSGADVSYCRLSRNRDIMDDQIENAHVISQTQAEAMYNLLYSMPEFGFYCYLYKKEVLERVNLTFDVHTRHFEDREFNWKYLCHCQTAVLVDAPLYYYRVNENSVTQNRKIQWRTDGLDAVKRIENYVEQQARAFLPELKSYLFPRVIWTMAKNYSLGGERALLKRLGQEYDVKTCMKRTAKDNNKLVALASRLYLIHPMLFYHIVRLKK